MKYNTEGHHALRAHHKNHIPNMCDTVFVFVFLRLACIWTLQNLFTKTVLKIDPMETASASSSTLLWLLMA